MTSKNISIAQKQSRIKAYINGLMICLMFYALFWVLSGVCFGIVDVTLRIKSSTVLGKFECDWLKFFSLPWYVFDVYQNWWNLLLKSFRLMQSCAVLFVPFIVPVCVLFSVLAVLIFRGFSFNLLYALQHHFAKAKDIRKMGLDKGLFMVLGQLDDMLLSVKPSDSVLCVGEMGTGKTSSVAIPSVLRSDNASIVAVDMTGLLPKYTAGHRSKLGRVLYYNWDLLDEPEKGLFYPRWNPLAKENIPAEQNEKDAYLKRIAGYLVNIGDLKNENYWNILTHSLMTSFLCYLTNKVEQATANDYFLKKLVEGKSFTKEEKDILLSFYIQMPPALSKEAIKVLESNKMTTDSYLPIGSWAGIPEQWIGKAVCFASVTDWLVINYLTMQDEHEIKDWQGWIGSLIREAGLFGYENLVVDGFKQFLALSARQRQIVFACALKPLQIFLNQALRERTDGNDFSLDDIRGIYDEKLQDWRPVTLYSLANTRSSKILNQMFIDEVTYRSLYRMEKQGPLPQMLVLDDVGHNLKLQHLAELVESGKGKKLSALLLCNSLSLVENTYGHEELERIVANTNYKIIKAADNFQLSRQIDRLATLAIQTDQSHGQDKYERSKDKLLDASNYFHKLALEFKLRKDIKLDMKNYQLVLAEGHYNCPILAKNIFFAEDERFNNLAVLDAEYSLPKEIIRKKDKLDLYTPKVSTLFEQKNIAMSDIVELDQYMNTIFDEISFEMEEDRKVKEEVVDNESSQEDSADWWLDEGAFNAQEKSAENPFNSKK